MAGELTVGCPGAINTLAHLRTLRLTTICGDILQDLLFGRCSRKRDKETTTFQANSFSVRAKNQRDP